MREEQCLYPGPGGPKKAVNRIPDAAHLRPVGFIKPGPTSADETDWGFIPGPAPRNYKDDAGF